MWKYAAGWLIGACALLTQPACNRAPNVAACESWLAELRCDGRGYGEAVECERYRTSACNVADYFGCLRERTVCDEGLPTIARWPECDPYLSCD